LQEEEEEDLAANADQSAVANAGQSAVANAGQSAVANAGQSAVANAGQSAVEIASQSLAAVRQMLSSGQQGLASASLSQEVIDIIDNATTAEQQFMVKYKLTPDKFSTMRSNYISSDGTVDIDAMERAFTHGKGSTSISTYVK